MGHPASNGWVETTAVDIERICRAMADPHRFALLERIATARGEVACRDILPDFDISQATISHHLKELTAVGLIDSRREGHCLMLRLRRDGIEAFSEQLVRRLGIDRPC